MKFCKMGRVQWLHSMLVLLVVITGVQCLRNVSLELIPEVVERGSQVTLRCHYLLDDMKLYATKWYRGKHEFYRYSPSEKPSTKTFKISGIKVDEENSNRDQVTIVNVDYGLSGNFCCEVTADAPTFATEYGVKKLLVVSLPKAKPNITTEHARYDAGDELRANCTVPASKPPVEFIFKLNKVQIGPINATILNDSTTNDTSDHHKFPQQYAQLSINVSAIHFTHNRLILRCIAQIPGGIYRNETEINLTAILGDPKSEKVTSDGNKTTATGLYVLGAVLALSILHFVLR